MINVPTRAIPWLLAAACLSAQAQPADPLPSWNEGASKAGIVAFVQAVTDTASKEFVPPEERVATFDNDGTLWAEQPLYVQFVFMLDQLKAAAPKHPEWKDDPAFAAMIKRDRQALAKLGQKPILLMLAATNSGMTVEAYDKTIRKWLETARHPKFKRPYTDLVYKPMQELLAHLRANGFKTFIVSGGSIEFILAHGHNLGRPEEAVAASRIELDDIDAQLDLFAHRLAEVVWSVADASKTIHVQLPEVGMTID